MYKSFAYLVLCEEFETGRKSIKIWSSLPQHKGYFISNKCVYSVMLEEFVHNKDPGNHFSDAKQRMLETVKTLGEYSNFWKELHSYLLKQDCDDCHLHGFCAVHSNHSDPNFKMFMRIQ